MIGGSFNRNSFLAAIALMIIMLGALSAAPAATAPAAGQQAEKLRHDVKVILKLIQVFVADKDGKPVKDLSKEDFRLTDNGEVKHITEFERHFPAEAAGLQPEAASPAAETPLLSRKFFLLFDARNSSTYGFNLSRKAALEFLDTQVRAGDEIGVLSYSDVAGFRVHEYLSTNHRRIRDIVDGLKEVIGASIIGYIKPIDDGEADAARDAQAEANRNKSGTTGSQGGASENRGGIISITTPGANEGSWFVRNGTAVGAEVESVAAKYQDFPLGLQMIAKALNGIPGSKNILLFSNGYPAGMILDERQPFSQVFKETGKELAASSSRVFSVNTAPKPWNAQGEVSLQRLSEATGGKYFESVAEYRDIAKSVQEFTGNYYVLGYSIADAWDGRFHEIKITVDRPGCEVAAPAGFSNSKPFTEYSALEKEIHLYDLAFSERSYFQSPVIFPMVSLPCSSGPKFSLLTLSRLPMEELAEITKGKTEFYQIVRDAKSRIVDARRAEVDFSKISPDFVFQYGVAEVEPGQYECRIVLRNPLTGQGAVAKKTIEVAQPENAAFRVFPPLLFLPLDAGRAQYINVSPAAKKKSDKPSPTLKDFYPLTAMDLKPVIDALPSDATELIFEMRIQYGEKEPQDLKMTAALLGPDKNEINLPLRLIGRKKVEGAIICLAKTELPHLGEGAYALKIAVTNKETGVVSRSEREFEIRSTASVKVKTPA